jgi:hypothetical protein
MELKIEYLPIEKLKPYSKNTRHHEDHDVDQIIKSINKYGFSDPIGIWSEKNIIVEGHGRLLAAKKIGMETVPVIHLDHLSDEERREYAIMHNRTAELSSWDFEMLSAELDDLDLEDFDFDLEELNVSAADFDDNAELDEVEVPETPEEPKSKQGQVYQLGGHRLICGDSTDPAVIDRLMDGVKADMVFTDPPYGMNLDTDFSGMQNHLDFAKEKGFTGGKKYEQGKVDEFHPEMIDAVFAIDADEMFLWGADYFAELLPNKNDGSWIVWDKRANGNDDSQRIIQAIKCMALALNYVGVRKSTREILQE